MKFIEDKNNALVVHAVENRVLIQNDDKCDKYDYLTAVACGAIGGMIDIFFVRTPGDSILEKWTDAQVDNAVKGFAKLLGWSPQEAKANSIGSAIGFLEKKFKVNYDQRYSTDVKSLFSMSTRNHHMMSLAHSPDVIGLFFSILNQFTSTSSFVANGQLITISTDTYELQGGNFFAKIFCGIANWFGHIMSDIAGSSGSRGNLGRGTGVVIPFYELFGLCKFGKFRVGQDKQDLATIAVRAFQEGYDLRFGIATGIPVVITDLSIRLIWALRRHFQYGRIIKECIPTKKHPDLRIMLLFGNGTLCVMDALDAGVRSGGNFLTFFMRLNLIAWFRLVTLVLKEICTRVGISPTLQERLDSYKRIREAMLFYLQELQKIDTEQFRKEKEKYDYIVEALEETCTAEELNVMLLDAFDRMEIKRPWQGDFEAHMANKNATLTFE